MIVRLALLIVYVLVALINLALVPPGYDFWGCAISAAFAIATVYFTGRATVFVLISVLVATCVAPIVAVGATEPGLHGSFVESCVDVVAKIIVYNPLHGLELLLPSLAAAASMALLQRWHRKPGEHSAR